MEWLLFLGFVSTLQRESIVDYPQDNYDAARYAAAEYCTEKSSMMGIECRVDCAYESEMSEPIMPLLLLPWVPCTVKYYREDKCDVILLEERLWCPGVIVSDTDCVTR